MDNHDLNACLAFLQSAENLKNTLRSAHTSAGRCESSAEHSWRLGLMVILFQREFSGLNLDKLMKLAVLHDLAEVEQNDSIDKGRLEFEAMGNCWACCRRRSGRSCMHCGWNTRNSALPRPR